LLVVRFRVLLLGLSLSLWMSMRRCEMWWE
jgi:hypothetical protein